MTKATGNYGFDHIYLRKSLMENFFFFLEVNVLEPNSSNPLQNVNSSASLYISLYQQRTNIFRYQTTDLLKN